MKVTPFLFTEFSSWFPYPNIKWKVIPKMNVNKTLHIVTAWLVTLSLFPAKVYSQENGNVTAIANPQAVSSGSVQNTAVQVLQGPYITNSYGGGVQCQGATINITPFTTLSQSGEGGLYWEPNSWNISPGISGTISIPLDGRAQAECLRAAQAHRERVETETAKARLDFELVRLLRCGEAHRAGVRFHPSSPYASVCSDVIVDIPQVVPPSPPPAPSADAS